MDAAIPLDLAARELSSILVNECLGNIPPKTRQWLHSRGITDVNIEEYGIGYGEFRGIPRITLPIRDTEGHLSFLKLRRLPDYPLKDSLNRKIKKYAFWPLARTLPFWSLNHDPQAVEQLLLCEGEFDAIIAGNQGLPAVTSTSGPRQFEIDWLSSYPRLREIYVAFDKDQEGEEASKLIIPRLVSNLPSLAIYHVNLPPEFPPGADITDFFIKFGGEVADITGKLATLRLR